MKLTLPWMMLPLCLGLGIGLLISRQGGKDSAKEQSAERRNGHESRANSRTSRTDPFGGQSFSLSSMEDIRELFKKQSRSVAAARLTLGVSSLTKDQIPALMVMAQQDARDNPNDYEARFALMSSLFERWALVDPSASIEFIKNCKQRSFQMGAASYCFNAVAQADPSLAMMELEKLPKGDLRSNAAGAILSALGDRDPAAACDFMLKEPSRGGFGSYYARQIFANWARTDPVAAAARLATMPLESVDRNTAGQLAMTWAQKDPEAALKWAKTLKGDWKADASIAVYNALSREDPAAAWARLQGEPGYLRGKLIGGVLNTVADEDPQKAVAMLKEIDSKSETRIAAGKLLENFAWSDSRMGFDILNQLNDPSIRREQLGDLMGYAAYMSTELLQEQVAKLTDREKVDTSRGVLSGLMRSDPAAAEKYFLALPEAQRSTDSLEYMMQDYSNKDPKKAFDFAISLTNPQEQTAAVNGVFANWSREDPEAAAEGWKRLPAGQSRMEALDRIAASWGGSDPLAAKQWADSLSGTERARALAAVLPALARDNPASAGTQLATLIAAPPDGMEKNLASSAASLAGKWATDDPSSAANWASALPDGQSRDEGLKAVSASWSQYDAIATAQWLGTLESGSSRDAAIQPLVGQIRKTDPNTAFSWAASISDDNQRLNQLRQTLNAWRGSDLKAARAALANADISVKDREALAKEVK